LKGLLFRLYIVAIPNDAKQTVPDECGEACCV